MRAAVEVSYRQAPDVLVRVVGTDVLVATRRDRAVHRLSGGAAAAWVELAEPQALQELVERLAMMHRAVPEAIVGDVGACVEQLLALGVIGAVDG